MCAEAATLDLNLLGKKLKIIWDFSRDQFSKAPHHILDVGETVWVKNGAINSEGNGEGSIVQPSHPKNGVPAPCASPD